VRLFRKKIRIFSAMHFEGGIWIPAEKIMQKNIQWNKEKIRAGDQLNPRRQKKTRFWIRNRIRNGFAFLGPWIRLWI